MASRWVRGGRSEGEVVSALTIAKPTQRGEAAAELRATRRGSGGTEKGSRPTRWKEEAHARRGAGRRSVASRAHSGRRREEELAAAAAVAGDSRIWADLPGEEEKRRKEKGVGSGVWEE